MPDWLPWVLVAAGTVLAAAVMVAFLRRRFSALPRKFAAVTPGALYRSGQGSAAQFRRAVEQYGIKTIICLRRLKPGRTSRWFREETSTAERLGVHFVHFPIVKNEVPPPAQVRDVLSVIADPARRPVLVHCARGEQRTGFFVAAHRLIVDGWPLAQAVAELESFGCPAAEKVRAVQALRALVAEHQNKSSGSGDPT